jgi:hypothetical protein
LSAVNSPGASFTNVKTIASPSASFEGSTPSISWLVLPIVVLPPPLLVLTVWVSTDDDLVRLIAEGVPLVLTRGQSVQIEGHLFGYRYEQPIGEDRYRLIEAGGVELFNGFERHHPDLSADQDIVAVVDFLNVGRERDPAVRTANPAEDDVVVSRVGVEKDATAVGSRVEPAIGAVQRSTG